MSAFESYASIYDALNHGKSYTREVDYLEELIGSFKGREVLDLGCGTGNFTEEFASRGARVRGLDISAEMIQIALFRRSRLDSRVHNSLEYEVANLCTYEPGIKRFDVITSMFHVINYQTTDAKLVAFFELADKALKPGGILIFDFWYGPSVLEIQPTRQERVVLQESLEISRKAYPTLRPEHNLVDVLYEFKILDISTSEIVSQFSELHSMRYLYLSDISRHMPHGLHIGDSFAWMKFIPPSKEDWSAVCILRKDDS